MLPTSNTRSGEQGKILSKRPTSLWDFELKQPTDAAQFLLLDALLLYKDKLMTAIYCCTLYAVISVSFPFQDSGEEFRPLFDGESLQGWKALNMSYWSVQDGAITAESTPDNPCTLNQFLVWQGGDVADFELKLKFRAIGNGCNSGVQFRSKMRPNGLAVGYQADIYNSGSYLGGVCDELHSRNGPELLTANGKKTVIDASGNRTATSLDSMATMKPFPAWNDYHIKAVGQHITLSINGVKSSELIDKEEAHFDLSGILGLQLRSGDPMKVQFKDIHLKQF